MFKKIFSSFKNIFKDKIFRFLLFGAIAAIFNVILLSAIIEILKLTTPIWRNVANVFSIELSLLFSFFIYRAWVWSIKYSTLQETLFRQIPRYHVSVGATIATRSFLIFPILDWLGIHYTINTLFGILVGSIVNYKISDRWVFKNKN